jgi:hypothetical protein
MSIMPNVNSISTHDGRPAIDQPVGVLDPRPLGDARRSRLRRMRSANAPWLRKIEYDERHDSIFHPPDKLNFRTLMANIYLNDLQNRRFAIDNQLC